jgi:PBP1b-binding outer membrane lipoprotein LpoB
MKKSIKTILILTALALTLGGCADGYHQKPDNKLKPSPCACNQFVLDSDSRELT